jgi:hypothetical protein
MMEAARTSETSVNFYQTARRYNTEDSHQLSKRLTFQKTGMSLYPLIVCMVYGPYRYIGYIPYIIISSSESL